MKNTSKRQNLSTPSDRIKHLRALLRVSRSFLQDNYSIPEVTLKSWENGTTKLTATAAKRCAEAYRAEGLIVSEDWILSGKGLDPTTTITVSQYFSEPSSKDIPSQDDEACMIRDANLDRKTYPNAV